MTKSSQNCIACLESTYNKMQRKHKPVPTVYEYQSSTSSHRPWLMIYIKHQQDRVLVDVRRKKFIYKQKLQSPVKNCQNFYNLKEYINISHQPADTRLMIDIKHQPGSFC